MLMKKHVSPSPAGRDKIIKWMPTRGRLKHFGITGDKQEHFELTCYETIDILQAQRLVNNPFAYAYISNVFEKDFPPWDPEETLP
ncbi:hypothetical protein TNCV_4037001 [Trichonephila clavipes]|nr:hypothetical protein TNCV_4037001 [Trichonephila clavipes]